MLSSLDLGGGIFRVVLGAVGSGLGEFEQSGFVVHRPFQSLAFMGSNNFDPLFL